MRGRRSSFYAGMALAVLSLILFLMHVRVGSGFRFVMWGRVNSGALCIIMAAVTLIALIVKPFWLTKVLFAATVLALVIDIIISVDVYLTRMSGFDLVLILAPGCVGIALMIKGLFSRKKKDED